MPSQAGARTRGRILDAAERLILDRGFAATSIDQIIDEVGITKGAFFYHYKTKADLARSLVERYAAADANLLDDNLSRAEKLSDDPLQQVLILVGLFLEMAEALEEPNPGCLFASYCYESGLFDEEIHQITAKAILRWREILSLKLRKVAETKTASVPVDPEGLADLLTVIFEGAFILSRVLKEPGIFAEQLRQYRTYLQLLFQR